MSFQRTASIRIPALLALAAGAAIASPAFAQTAFLDQTAQAPGVCQAALPAFEGLIRKRPLAIQNEGTATAFVSCAMPQFRDPALQDPDLGISLAFVNISAADVTVNCTGVSFSGTFNFIPLSVVVPAGTTAENGGTSLAWNEQDDNGSGEYTTVSCALPPGAGISFVSSLSGEVTVPEPVVP